MGKSIINKGLALLSKPGNFRALLSIYSQGYLAEEGWFKSFETQSSISAYGDPIPWVTYSFIEFISSRLTDDLLMVEYGSGNSSLFYAKRVKRLYSVEHDAAWFEKLNSLLPPNATLTHIPLEYGGEYSKFAGRIGVSPQIVIVDGRDRVNCVKESASILSSDGVLVLDDSERTSYGEVYDFMKGLNFKKIDFWGMAPGVINKKSTTVFYRSQNCLHI